ncbi:hypothetical protein HDK77DRAFT_16275 [Phyllosticta capitalensis]|uniref:Uncharacterized protein n=1 Tax=Phyllosticta capitalensis TaxID=121624 RepID=A0ABR1YZ67_9PEZI
MADPPQNRRADGCDSQKKRGASKSCLRERILEGVSRRLPQQSRPTDQARAGGSTGGYFDHLNSSSPLIIVGDVQHLSLGPGSGQPPTFLSTEPQQTTYFSGTRNVSITGGLSRSVCHCKQGHGEENAAAGCAPSRRPPGAGEGSITVIDGELHNPTIHLQAPRYFNSAHGSTCHGGASMNAHQPVTRPPVNEEMAAPIPAVADDNLDPTAPILSVFDNHLDATAIQPDPAVFQPAANSAAAVPPSIHSNTGYVAEVPPPDPPIHLDVRATSSPMTLSPRDYQVVTPEPYHQRREHGYAYGYDAAADNLHMSGGARLPSSDIGHHPFTMSDGGAGEYSPSPAPRHAGGEGNGVPAGRNRATGSSWLLRRIRRMKKKSDEEIEWEN